MRTRLTDGKKTIEITMQAWADGQWSPDWSTDFFNVAALPSVKDEDGEIIAHVVGDVDYCIEQANDWRDNTGDFADDLYALDPGDKSVEVTIL